MPLPLVGAAFDINNCHICQKGATDALNGAQPITPPASRIGPDDRPYINGISAASSSVALKKNEPSSKAICRQITKGFRGFDSWNRIIRRLEAKIEADKINPFDRNFMAKNHLSETAYQQEIDKYCSILIKYGELDAVALDHEALEEIFDKAFPPDMPTDTRFEDVLEKELEKPKHLVLHPLIT